MQKAIEPVKSVLEELKGIDTIKSGLMISDPSPSGRSRSLQPVVKRNHPPSRDRAWVKDQLSELKSIQSLPKLQDLSKKWDLSKSQQFVMQDVKQLVDSHKRPKEQIMVEMSKSYYNKGRIVSIPHQWMDRKELNDRR